jgi:hypothetical protein
MEMEMEMEILLKNENNLCFIKKCKCVEFLIQII